MNIIDYLNWRGDISLKVDPFNNVDNLLFSALAYINFDGVLSKERVSIKDVSKIYYARLKEDKVKQVTGFASACQDVLRVLAESDRFGDCTIYNYINRLNKDNVEQFSALTIDLPDNTTYIAYRGTDDSLIGWKEDFELSYKSIPAQKAAQKYLENTINVFGKYRVGGHSKGGHLALYAACKCSEKAKKRIIAVYNNDGPGLSDALFSQDEFDSIKDRYIKIMPEFDVFGLMYNRDDKPIIVKSSEKAIMQHSLMSWMVERNKLIQAKDFNIVSQYVNDSLNDFVKSVSVEQRESFVNEFCEALSNAGIKNISQLSNSDISLLIKVFKEISDMNKESKEIGTKLIKELVDASSQGIKKQIFGGRSDV